MLTLSRDGIFPVTKDRHGNRLPDLPATGFPFPGTIQGEGKLNGIPSLFVRLAGCNLHCHWKTISGTISVCDTAYASYEVEGSYSLAVDDIYAIIRHNTETINHIVITGGEPLLQSKELKYLFSKLKEDHLHLTIETNATLFDNELAHYIDFFSLSPKLAGSTPDNIHRNKHSQTRINIKNIQAFIDHSGHYNKDFQLKFVNSCETDIAEIKSILTQLKGWKDDDILLMPLGGNLHDMRLNVKNTISHCIRNNWRYCDRLHISLWGDKQGI